MANKKLKIGDFVCVNNRAFNPLPLGIILKRSKKGVNSWWVYSVYKRKKDIKQYPHPKIKNVYSLSKRYLRKIPENKIGWFTKEICNKKMLEIKI